MSQKFRPPYPWFAVTKTNVDKLSAANEALIPSPLYTAMGHDLLRAVEKENLHLFLNRTGADLAVGSLLIPAAYTNVVTVVTAALAVDDTAMTLANDLSAVQGTFRLILTNASAAFASGTVAIVGKNELGNTVTESVTISTASGGVWVSDSLWTEITSITPVSIASSTATLAVTAYPVGAMKNPAATADLTTVCGICRGKVGGYGVDAVPDGMYGYMASSGIITKALVYSADLKPGDVLGTSANTAGYLGAVSTVTHGSVVARLLDHNVANKAATLQLYVLFLGGC